MPSVILTINFAFDDFWMPATEAVAAVMQRVSQRLPAWAVHGEPAGRDQAVFIVDLERADDADERTQHVRSLLRRAADDAGYPGLDMWSSHVVAAEPGKPHAWTTYGAPKRPVSQEASSEDVPQRAGVAVEVTEDDETLPIAGLDPDLGANSWARWQTGLVSVVWEPEGHDGVQRGPQRVPVQEAVAWALTRGPDVHLRLGREEFHVGEPPKFSRSRPWPGSAARLERRFEFEPAFEPRRAAWWFRLAFTDYSDEQVDRVVVGLCALSGVFEVRVAEGGEADVAYEFLIAWSHRPAPDFTWPIMLWLEPEPEPGTYGFTFEGPTAVRPATDEELAPYTGRLPGPS